MCEFKRLEVGMVCKYKGRKVVITSGSYLVGGLLSNHFHFRYIDTGESGSDYDLGQFTEKPDSIEYAERMITGAISSYAKHFTDPLAAAEADLLGEALLIARCCAARICTCNKRLSPDVTCVQCASRDLLAKVKEAE